MNKSRVQLEIELAAQGASPVDVATVKEDAADLQNLLIEADLSEKKTFLRTFIKRIEIKWKRR